MEARWMFCLYFFKAYFIQNKKNPGTKYNIQPEEREKNTILHSELEHSKVNDFI